VNSPPVPSRLEPAAPGAKVTRLELFYDLVFVYAFLNVARVTSVSLSPSALAKGLLVLALLWFAWTTFAALGNVVRADQGVMPLIGFAIMAGIFALALTAPEAFKDDRRGLPGDLVLAASYFVVRGLQVLAFFYAGGTLGLGRVDLWLGLPVLISSALLFVAATVPRHFLSGNAEFAARAGLWLLAIALEYVASALARVEDVVVTSAGHLAERYAQIILIAFGESIISLGTGPNLIAGLPLTWPVLAAVGLGIAIIAALWWAYSDSVAIAAEEALHRTRGAQRVRQARDAYVYLHLPMIIGIILFGLGLKKALADVGDPLVPSVGDTLHGVEGYVLSGGVTLYLLGLTAFRWRTVGGFDRFALVAIALVAIQIPIGAHIPEFQALALLALVTIGQIVVAAIRGRHPRRALRGRKLAERQALEAEETEWRRRHAP
jgi:low temperature requirement protein LtrA